MAVEISGPTPGTPVVIEAADQLGRPGRDLFLSVIEYREERLAEGARAGPDSNALLDQKGADLVDRRCSTGHQSRPHPVASLQVQLILALLVDEPQVRP